MASLVLENVVKQYGRVKAVREVSLSIADAEFIALLGPSGCGKTSTMRMVAGLENISAGTIRIDGAVVNDRSPAERQIAMSFEHYGLYPHLTLFANIAYPLAVRGTAEREIKTRVFEIASLLHIEDLLGSHPKEVSSGVQQRVSLARALVRSPSVFLLDEPLSHLDAEMRSRMRGELKRLQKAKRSTMLYVTHDQLEAMTMADRIAIMHEGRLQQVGTPREIYDRPANRFVATFIGEPPMNMIDATTVNSDDSLLLHAADGGRIARLDGEPRQRLLDAVPGEGGRVALGVRPTDVQVVAPGEAGMPARVRLREFRGDDVLMTFDTAGTRVRAIVRRDGARAVGDHVVLVPRGDRLHLFSAGSGDAIGHTEDSVHANRQSSLIH
jgi:multiple sugar transport system ATP-binding protein